MLVGSHTARRPDWPAVHVHTSAGAARVEHNRELSAIVSWRRTLAASTAVVVPPVEKARQQHNPDQHHEQAADEIFALPWNQIRRRCRRTCTTSRPTGTVVSQRSGSVCGFNVLQHSKPRSVLLHRNAPPHDGRNVQLYVGGRLQSAEGVGRPRLVAASPPQARSSAGIRASSALYALAQQLSARVSGRTAPSITLEQPLSVQAS